MKRLLFLLVVAILATSFLPMCVAKIKAETPNIPDPTPGYDETSEFAIGNYSVGVIFPESNGAIDPNTENWTNQEIEQVMTRIQYALDNWTSMNPNVSLSFTVETHTRVPTSYEPISHSHSEDYLWIDETMNYLGYKNRSTRYQTEDYVNDLRRRFNTDWGFIIFVVDASNDANGLFGDGWRAWATGFVTTSRIFLVVSVKTVNLPANLELTVGHEMGHIFWASDEYNGVKQYLGYLNVSDVDGSGCIMDTVSTWTISGKPDGLNGTWGQIGWRDSNGNGVPDIVDTPQLVYLNPYERVGNRITITGVATVTPTQNKNPMGSQSNVTINRVQSVQFQLDNGEWLNASMTPTTVRKLVKYPDTYFDKETFATVNFTFSTPELGPGTHFIQIRAINQWGISGYSNQTVTITSTVHEIALTNISPYRNILGNSTTTSINVTVLNQGDISETFNVTLFYNSTTIETQMITLNSQTSTRVKFSWNTLGLSLENFTLKAEASQVPGETNTSDNILTYSTIIVSINGDINADGKVNIVDVTIAATAYGTQIEQEKWNANADIDESLNVNIVDITLIAKNYGKTV